jgi:probable addiction module antidote protein
MTNTLALETQQAEFIELLQKRAKAYGMSQLANELGCSRPSLYKSLQLTAGVRFETVLAIATLLGVSMSVSYED